MTCRNSWILASICGEYLVVEGTDQIHVIMGVCDAFVTIIVFTIILLVKDLNPCIVTSLPLSYTFKLSSSSAFCYIFWLQDIPFSKCW